jgi:predicted nucleic acid-binding protein
MRIADTNVLLGLIVSDRPEHAAFAEAATDASADPVTISELVLAEAAWVLGSVYGITGRVAARLLGKALEAPGVAVWDRLHAKRALALMDAEPSLGMVDCLLLERVVASRAELISFDQRLTRRAAEYVEL